MTNEQIFFSMALPAHSGPWPLIHFRNHFYTDGRTPWTSDQSVARPLPTHRTTRTQNKRIHTRNIHALSGIRTHDPSVRASEDISYLRLRTNRAIYVEFGMDLDYKHILYSV
jgi:hypothetical protein